MGRNRKTEPDAEPPTPRAINLYPLFGLVETAPGEWSMVERMVALAECTQHHTKLTKNRALEHLRNAINAEYIGKPAATTNRMDFSRVDSGPLRSPPPGEPR